MAYEYTTKRNTSYQYDNTALGRITFTVSAELVGPDQPWTQQTAGKMIGRERRGCTANYQRKLGPGGNRAPLRYITGFHHEKKEKYRREDCYLTGRVKEADRPGEIRTAEWCCPVIPRTLCRANEREYACGLTAPNVCNRTGKKTYLSKIPIWCCPPYSRANPPARELTEEELRQHGNRCQPWISPAGETKERVLRWYLKYYRSFRTDQDLNISDGDYRLVCVLANPTFEDIAYGKAIPESPEEEQRQIARSVEAQRAGAQTEAERILMAAEEKIRPWYVRHWLLLLLSGGALFTGITAALIQRALKE